ncbi:MAG: immunoglobulin domain-containing protein, partial [bacterium]
DLNNAPSTGLSIPTITTQPTAQKVTVGSPVTFAVVATGDSLSYQWYKGTTAISGATTKSFTISSTVLADAGLYQVVLANSAATLASDTVRLDVVVPQSIIAYKLIGGTASSTNQGYISTSPDESAVFVSAAGDLTLISTTINKSGNASSPSASKQSGTNSAVLATAAAKVTIVGGSVSSDSAGATALFATGAGTSIAMYNGSVSATGASSYGVAAAQGGTVRLEQTSLKSNSGTLASATGSSNVTIIADADSLAGDLVADATSSIALTLQKGAKLTGTVQRVALTMDATSTWTVTATSVLTTLTNAGISGLSITNIVGNGFTVYYALANAGNAALGGKTYTLVGGGSLVPQ